MPAIISAMILPDTANSLLKAAKLALGRLERLEGDDADTLGYSPAVKALRKAIAQAEDDRRRNRNVRKLAKAIGVEP